MSRKEEKETNTSIECKKFVLAAVKMINNGERYFFAKFMEDFYELAGKHQRGIIQYIAEKYENKKWKELENDSTK